MSAPQPLDIKMNRKGFGLRGEVQAEIQGVYASSVIEEIKQAGYSKTFGRITIRLAKEFGFCYGVDRAVELAYETRRNFPDKKIYLTTEIIHNPTVNQNLLDMGICFLSGPQKNADECDIKPEDVVIVPAFGNTVAQLQSLANTGCTLVDTICGSVINVWKRVERYAQEGFTSVIHGKHDHEETMATSSRVLQFPNSHYLVVFSEAEAQYACDYLVAGGNRDEFLKKFAGRVSENFDPDLHLSHIGLANQTTMLSSESLHISSLFRKALAKRFGEAELPNRYRSFDTICSATQERQDAMKDLSQHKLDLVLVVGGYNSSNTGHLHEIALKTAPSFHINRPECLVDAQTLSNKPFDKKEEIVTTDWLPAGPISVGITAGASTPNKVMGDVIERLIAIQ